MTVSRTGDASKGCTVPRFRSAIGITVLLSIGRPDAIAQVAPESERAQLARNPGVGAENPPATPIEGAGELQCRVLLEAEQVVGCDRCATRGVSSRTVTIDSAPLAVSLSSTSVVIRTNRPRSTQTRLSPDEVWAATVPPPPLRVLSDDRDQIGAGVVGDGTHHTFVLNRHNGLAIWGRTKAFVNGYDGPLAMNTYMSCRKIAG